MLRFKNYIFACVFLLLTISHGHAFQNVKVEGITLKEDFDHDGVFKPFFVKGVGYAPIPIGHFMGSGDGWSADCYYTGPYPLTRPDRRFKPNSVDASFACNANGTNHYQNLAALDRDFKLLKAMNANTIRTWGPVTPELLQKANEYGIKVIAGYWIDYATDFTFPNSKDGSGLEIPGSGQARRQIMIDNFAYYVNTYKDNPAILMWGLSNENNVHFCDPCLLGASCNLNNQAAGFYKLMNDMAVAAKNVEGNSSHPTMIVTAELGNASNYSSLIPDINMIGVNSYRGKNFDGYPPPKLNLFDEFKNAFPAKGLLITEFGVDAWNTNGYLKNPEKGYEDQVAQADWCSSAWDDIKNHSIASGGPVNGGVVFHYSDVYTKYAEKPNAGQCDWISSDWTPSVITRDHGHPDPNIFGNGSMPDDVENPEWWGIVGTELNSVRGQLDVMTPRLVYDALKQRYAGLNISIIVPTSENTFTTSQSSVVVSAKVEADYGIKKVLYRVNNGAWKKVQLSFGYLVTVNNLTVGTTTVKFKVVDANGNTAVDSLKIIRQ